MLAFLKPIKILYLLSSDERISLGCSTAAGCQCLGWRPVASSGPASDKRAVRELDFKTEDRFLSPSPAHMLSSNLDTCGLHVQTLEKNGKKMTSSTQGPQHSSDAAQGERPVDMMGPASGDLGLVQVPGANTGKQGTSSDFMGLVSGTKSTHTG